jgi:hypothetical protein
MPEESRMALYDAIVTKDYAAQYTDPITLVAGETTRLDGREEPWEENPDWIWIWGENTRGKSGWIPRTLLTITGTAGIAREDYDARELTVAAGEMVAVMREESGWAWCVTSDGRDGWVPLSHLLRAP